MLLFSNTAGVTVDANVIATADVIVVNAVADVDGASVAATSSGVVVAGVAGFHGYHCLKTFCNIYTEKTGLDADHDKLVRQFHHAFMHENALNPMIFPSLRYLHF